MSRFPTPSLPAPTRACAWLFAACGLWLALAAVRMASDPGRLAELRVETGRVHEELEALQASIKKLQRARRPETASRASAAALSLELWLMRRDGEVAGQEEIRSQLQHLQAQAAATRDQELQRLRQDLEEDLSRRERTGALLLWLLSSAAAAALLAGLAILFSFLLKRQSIPEQPGPPRWQWSLKTARRLAAGSFWGWGPWAVGLLMLPAMRAGLWNDQGYALSPLILATLAAALATAVGGLFVPEATLRAFGAAKPINPARLDGGWAHSPLGLHLLLPFLAAAARQKMPLADALRAHAGSAHSRKVGERLKRTAELLESGKPFVEATQAADVAAWPRTLASIIAAGEAAGVLRATLEAAATSLKDESVLLSGVRDALLQEAAVGSLLCAFGAWLFLGIQPLFISVLESLGTELPEQISFLLDRSRWLALGAPPAFACLLYLTLGRSYRRKDCWGLAGGWGSIRLDLAEARLCRFASALAGAGGPVEQALTTAFGLACSDEASVGALRERFARAWEAAQCDDASAALRSMADTLQESARKTAEDLTVRLAGRLRLAWNLAAAVILAALMAPTMLFERILR